MLTGFQMTTVECGREVELPLLGVGVEDRMADMLNQLINLLLVGVDVGALEGAGRKALRQFSVPLIG